MTKPKSDPPSMKRLKVRLTPEARAIFERAGGKVTPEEEAHGSLVEGYVYDWFAKMARRTHTSMSDLFNLFLLENPLLVRAWARKARRERARKRRRL